MNSNEIMWFIQTVIKMMGVVDIPPYKSCNSLRTLKTFENFINFDDYKSKNPQSRRSIFIVDFNPIVEEDDQIFAISAYISITDLTVNDPDELSDVIIGVLRFDHSFWQLSISGFTVNSDALNMYIAIFNSDVQEDAIYSLAYNCIQHFPGWGDKQQEKGNALSILENAKEVYLDKEEVQHNSISDENYELEEEKPRSLH